MRLLRVLVSMLFGLTVVCGLSGLAGCAGTGSSGGRSSDETGTGISMYGVIDSGVTVHN